MRDHSPTSGRSLPASHACAEAVFSHNPRDMRFIRAIGRLARAIVCIAGGMSGQNLPLEDGWERVYTAVQLQADGFGPTIVFSGGGTAQISEAEVYAEAARWLGAPDTNRLKWGLDRLLTTLRELVAIGAYKVRGDA